LSLLTLEVGPPANGGSCIAHHDGRVVFVRYALPGETVRVRVTGRRESYWTADAMEIVEPSTDRIDPICPIAGADGAGCCDLSFVSPAALRVLKGQVLANQLQRLGGLNWSGEAQPVADGTPTGWRCRVRLAVGADGQPGFHRYHSAELAAGLNCAQVGDAMLAGLPAGRFTAGDEVHVVADDDRVRHVVCTGPGRSPRVVEGGYEAVQRVGDLVWRLPVTAFWQAHRDAAAVYSTVVAQWSQLGPGMTAWDLYGGAGLFAAAMAPAVGAAGHVVSVDTSRAAARAGRAALADAGQVRFVTDSVHRALASQRVAADVAVLDPPRAGAGGRVIDLIAAAGVPRVIHIGCEAAAFARDIGLYRRHGYTVERLELYDAFPLTHHVECVALLTSPGRRFPN
jgi:tRNA/tmRNA/rRNA uracil-C5-methylase (TrmA/RlmC/RlmD family)